MRQNALDNRTILVTFFTNFDTEWKCRMKLLRHTSALRPLLVGVLLALTALPAAAADVDSTKTVDHSGDVYIIETRHRLFPDFLQVDTVGFDQPFFIGEEEWKARIILFNPHLGITTEGKGLQMSDTLYNPAARIRVEQADTLVQESWAFHYVDAPHYRRTDLLGFKLLDFKVAAQYIPAPDKK